MIISAEKKDNSIAVFSVTKDIFQNIPLIRELAKNDFKKRFAGSYLGILWAFVNPIVTILVYWFVFEVGMRNAPEVNGYPYVLWMISGLVPWFLFSEILSSGTSVFTDYSYLVKKLLFNVSLLPIAKVITATIIHLFFVALMIIIYICMGYMPTVYMVQIVYYMIATWVLSAALVYMTSSVVVFFRDLAQVVSIFLQVFIWITPIMWQDTQMLGNHPVIARLIQLNPMYYIVYGYRDAMIHHVWFWEKPGMTLYFWVVTVGLFVLGTSVFKRLKPHFADCI